jgi:anti-sigma regulatory factor (Ser/Thr protein kinase)
VNRDLVPSSDTLHHAQAVRARAALICARSRSLQDRAATLTELLVTNLDERPLGDRGERFSLRLARILPAVGLARRAIERWLERRGVPQQDIHEISLACSEACANAVEHPVASGGGAFEIEARLGPEEVTIVVRDSGRWRAEEANEARGRGLQLIGRLMTAVDVVRSENGTAIVMRRRLD